MTKIRPDNVLIGMILWNPTPAVLNALDEPSASIPMNGNTIMANIKQIPKLLSASPSGFFIGSINPECNPEDNLAPKILIKLPLSPENSGTNVNKLGFVSNVSTELFKIPPADPPKKEHRSKIGVDCLKIVFVSSDKR